MFCYEANRQQDVSDAILLLLFEASLSSKSFRRKAKQNLECNSSFLGYTQLLHIQIFPLLAQHFNKQRFESGADLGGGEGRSSHGQNFKTYFFPITYQRKISDIIQITTIVLSGLKPGLATSLSFGHKNRILKKESFFSFSFFFFFLFLFL